MSTINTVAPIPIEELKKYFSDNTVSYTIDYANSTIKGAKLLTYLSNLDLPCDISFSNPTDKTELLKEYFNTTLLVNVSSLENMALDVLYEAKGLQNNGMTQFIEENFEIVNRWISILDSLTLFNLYTINDEKIREFVESYPIDETNSTQGINFISLLDHPELYGLYGVVSEDSLKFYKTYFDAYMFKGKNLYHYWANQNNPLFLLTWGISAGMVTAAELDK